MLLDKYWKEGKSYEDCCTIFVSKHPKTNPKLDKIEKEEEKLDIDSIVDEVIESLELMTF